MKRSYVLTPEDRAHESLRTILASLLHSLRSNIDGVLEDTDPDFLHDLRVATRRTRTALTRIKGVLPSPVKETFVPEFKWLGTITGPLRDLDVHLISVPTYQRIAGIQPDVLGGLQAYLEDARRPEMRKVSTAIRSARFQSLIENWKKYLESDPSPDGSFPLASAAIVDVAAPRIFKAYRRIERRGADAGADAPAALLHRLRIDGKNLRYLLEFFADLFPLETVEQFIVELKRLQDILGEFNDTEAQLIHIGEFEKWAAASGSKTPPIAADISRLIDVIRRRQLELRTEFADRFTRFSSAEGHRLYRETFRSL
jgi:CHAD domain-containing protein